METVTKVEMADFRIARAPDILSTHGLGSCVAVCLYDPKIKLGGLAHVMLPSSKGQDPNQCGRYADTAVDALIRLMSQHGATGLSAKIVGGAAIIAPQKTAITVGKNNIEVIRYLLAGRNIRILAEDTGGAVGRTVRFDVATGAVLVGVLTNPITRVTL